MSYFTFLLSIPALVAVLLFLIRHARLRSVIVALGAAVIAAGSVVSANFILKSGTVQLPFESSLFERILQIGEYAILVYLLFRCRGIKRHEWWIPVLLLVQAGVGVMTELRHVSPVEFPVFADNLSAIMVLIIGVIGSLICWYAVNYMHVYHHHHADIKDRQPFFFFLLFFFLSAMFGIVLTNNLKWLFVFWEITTLCSFELIGYSQTEEAKRNAYRALGFNSLGGLGFAGALLYQSWFSSHPTFDMHTLIHSGAAVALIPAVLISFAGITKSAQMPFASWLLGAMVAPTPVSALLHSSTMVKAGVFIILKFSPVLEGTPAGKAIAFVGGISFLMTAILAATQRNAKRVLAYSTIGNLGLIVMCAGIGGAEAIWAAILIIIFHAISKALLFLGVGTLEHRIGSRDIEDIDGLMTSKPWMSAVLMIGILGMFLAPFGMLISKWACLGAFIQSSPLFAIMIAFGSAPTIFFWAKWLGKLATTSADTEQLSGSSALSEKLVLILLAVMTVCVSLLFPVMSSSYISPYILDLYGRSVSLGFADLLAIFVMFGMIAVLVLSFIFTRSQNVNAPIYLAGLNVEGSESYTGAMGHVKEVRNRNYYLLGFVDEIVLTRAGDYIAIVMILAMGVLCARNFF